MLGRRQHGSEKWTASILHQSVANADRS